MDWQTTESELELLAAKVIDKPDIIVALVRGGLVPARLLATRLAIKDMYCLSVRKQGDERKVTTQILDDISGSRVLLVEDMLETGTSAIAAKHYLESIGAIVKLAALYKQSRSQIMPDYYLEDREEVPLFPWE